MLKHLLIALIALIASPLLAASSATLEHTRVELLSETQAPSPDSLFIIAVAMKPKPGWHTYWSNPGDSGMPTRAGWTFPPGFTASEFHYPVPKTYVVSGIMNHVFAGESWLLADIKVPAGWDGAIPVKVRLDWLVCNEELCVPEGADLSLDLKTGRGVRDPALDASFSAARDALPRPLLFQESHFAVSNGRIRLSVPLANPETVTGAHFFSSSDDNFVFSSPQTISRTADALIIEADVVANSQPTAIPGVLRIERGDEVMGLSFTATPGAVAVGEPLKATSSDSQLPSFWLALGLALLGGLLLNLMPCVFPILSLKALSLARAGESTQTARSEGVAYTLGVVLITTLLGLAAILIARAGAGAGWAFQLQDPRVILFLMLLTFAIALNFAGLFEVNIPALSKGQSLAAKPGVTGAFFTGVLAAFVATPCTGPFMAGALGAALILPPAAGLAIFAGLGLGLALPFLLIGFIPALRRRLPRPGPWMLTFRRILAVPMLLTALALAWVLGRQVGVNGLMLGLSVAVMMACGLWLIGIRQQKRTPVATTVSVLALLVILTPLLIARLPAESAAVPETRTLNAVAFSDEALAKAQAERRPIFLYFTADWCITCKVNEKGALSDDAVAQAFQSAGILTMVGDWTRPNPEIARFLADRKRAGIPLYLFYAADGSIRELPQLLTVDMLTDLASPGSANPV